MPELNWLLGLPLNPVAWTQMSQTGCKAHKCVLFLLPHGPQGASMLLMLFLTQSTNPFPCYAALETVRMLPGIRMSQWDLPCTLTQGAPGSDGLGTWHKTTCSFRDKYTALSDSVFKMDQRQNSTHMGRNHLARTSFPCCPYLTYSS